MSAPPTAPQAAELAAAAQLARAEWFIVQNPGSGPTQRGEKRQQLERALAATGRRYRFLPVGAGGVLVACQLGAQWAAASGGVLVAAGGDGTLNCAAQAAMQHRCPLGVIPQGTFNLFARDYDIPLEVEAAVQALATALPRPVQVGLVNQHVFLANASVGLYPKLLEDREALKEQLGKRRRWIAAVSSLKTLVEWRWQMRLETELDGELKTLRTPSLFVCNNRSQLGFLGVDDAILERVGSGRMACVVAHPLDFGAKLRLLWLTMTGRLADAREVDCHAFRSLAVTTRFARRIKVATDGEVLWMDLPLRFSVSPTPLVLMVPR